MKQPIYQRASHLLGLLALAACPVLAHHSTAAIYDTSRTIEISGVVESFHWRNPHGLIVLAVEDENGATVHWEVETQGVSILRNREMYHEDIIGVGDRITIAGAPARRNVPELNASSILLRTGYELPFEFGNAEPHFEAGKNGNIVGRNAIETDVEQAIAEADGIFRVWSTILGDPAAFPMFKGNYPLTQAAEDYVALWDPLDNELLKCGTKGHPLIMITPFPVEFVNQGDQILLRIEEFDALRVIHMDPNAVAPDEFTQMGFSRGRFDGRTLIVETDHTQMQYFDMDGVPQSERLATTEYFMPNEDYTRMDYRITVEDPIYFSEPFDLTRYFVWRPENRVNLYECLDRF